MACELSSSAGVLEPLQTAVSLDGQVQELKSLLERWGTPPVTLIGWSWGAWLSFILAAQHPTLVRKLILVGSPPFEQHYVPSIVETRFARLTHDEQRRVEALQLVLHDAAVVDKGASLSELGGLLSRADAFDPLPAADAPRPTARGDQGSIYQRVWEAAALLRAEGTLLSLAGKIRCPVVALHGDHDPHPTEGVQVPLTRALSDFRFVMLDQCGHEPWNERHARDQFYAILRRELPDDAPARSN